MKQKIVLLHGWNYSHYNTEHCQPYWDDKKIFMEGLAENFEIYPIYLPGFCGVGDPPRAWDLEDYARFVELWLNRRAVTPDFLLGWSFGGAVALIWKRELKKKTSLILVSPAILRKYRRGLPIITNALAKILPETILRILRDFYLIRLIKNPYYLKASGTMRQTYRKIVKRSLIDEAFSGSDNEIGYIFGERDTATPPALFLKELGRALKNFSVIRDAGHDIAHDAPQALIGQILELAGKLNIQSSLKTRTDGIHSSDPKTDSAAS